MTLNQAIEILMQVMLQQTLSVQGQNVPALAKALEVCSLHLQNLDKPKQLSEPSTEASSDDS